MATCLASPMSKIKPGLTMGMITRISSNASIIKAHKPTLKKINGRWSKLCDELKIHWWISRSVSKSLNTMLNAVAAKRMVSNEPLSAKASLTTSCQTDDLLCTEFEKKKYKQSNRQPVAAASTAKMKPWNTPMNKETMTAIAMAPLCHEWGGSVAFALRWLCRLRR